MLCLNLAMVFVPIFGLASLFAALTFIKSLNDGKKCFRSRPMQPTEQYIFLSLTEEVVLLPAVLSAGFGFISGVLGVVSTGKVNLCSFLNADTHTIPIGTNPHFASVAANEKQNVLAELENEYATLAIDLLEMYNSW